MKFLAFGEILWDIVDGKEHIGGACFNLSAHLSKMGADSYIISSIGNDSLGESAVHIAESLNINTDFISVNSSFPTGTVDVVLHPGGMPEYTINTDTAWDNIIITDETMEMISGREWDVFCFGSIAQRTEINRQSLNKVFEHIKPREVFCDINIRQTYFSMEIIEDSFLKSSIVKLNDEESDFLSRYLYGEKFSMQDFAEKIISRYNIKIVCITRGADGASVFYDGKSFHLPCEKIKVADTIGAGDSFSAGFLASYISGNSPEKSIELGVKVGAFIASNYGAVPEYSAELIGKIKEYTV